MQLSRFKSDSIANRLTTRYTFQGRCFAYMFIPHCRITTIPGLVYSNLARPPLGNPAAVQLSEKVSGGGEPVAANPLRCFSYSHPEAILMVYTCGHVVVFGLVVHCTAILSRSIWYPPSAGQRPSYRGAQLTLLSKTSPRFAAPRGAGAGLARSKSVIKSTIYQ